MATRGFYCLLLPISEIDLPVKRLECINHLSLFIHMVQLSSLNSVKFFLGIILCTLPSSLQAIQQSVLISASHYV